MQLHYAHITNESSKTFRIITKICIRKTSLLACTDVASRGLDLPNIDTVISYDLPRHGKEYIHRVGRTACAGKTIALITQYDVEVYQRIEALLGTQLPEYQLNNNAKELF